MEALLIENLNKLATFKVIRGSFDYLKEYQYVTLGFSCRTDFYNEETGISALSKLIRQYVNSLDIPYDLVEIASIDKIKFKDLHRYNLDSYFIRVLIKGTIY